MIPGEDDGARVLVDRLWPRGLLLVWWTVC
jgi:uncharacterized protein YeaO (DUF488 family)